MTTIIKFTFNHTRECSHGMVLNKGYYNEAIAALRALQAVTLHFAFAVHGFTAVNRLFENI